MACAPTASASPCDPRTLARAARDLATKEPEFAVGAGLLALHWLANGVGYEVTGSDVLMAYSSTIAAAERKATFPTCGSEYGRSSQPKDQAESFAVFW